MTTMDTLMELDDFKSAWKILDARLAQQNRLQFELLRERKTDQARRNLRPLFRGQFMQILLGIGLIVLGVACWSRNPNSITLFATGIVVHVFGVLHIILAGATMGRIMGIDYSAPVKAIQQRLTRLLLAYRINSSVCGLGWWVMWMPVSMAFAGIWHIDLARVAPSFLWSGIVISLVGLVGTGLYFWRLQRRAASSGTDTGAASTQVGDGADGIRRNLRVYDELERFERE